MITGWTFGDCPFARPPFLGRLARRAVAFFLISWLVVGFALRCLQAFRTRARMDRPSSSQRSYRSGPSLSLFLPVLQLLNFHSLRGFSRPYRPCAGTVFFPLFEICFATLAPELRGVACGF